MSIVMEMEGRSAIKTVMEEMLEDAWSRWRLESLWKALQNDQAMQGFILARIRGLVEEKSRSRMLEMDTLPRKTCSVGGKLEHDEHSFLDGYLVDTVPGETGRYVVYDPNWEKVELENLECVLEMGRPKYEAEHMSGSIMMKSYLEMTDLSTKRMLCVTEVEPQTAESEVIGIKKLKYDDSYGDDKDNKLSAENMNVTGENNGKDNNKGCCKKNLIF